MPRSALRMLTAPTLLVTHAHTRDPLQPGHRWLRVVDTSLEATEDALLEGGEPLRCVRRGLLLACMHACVDALGIEQSNQQQQEAWRELPSR